MGYKIQIPTLDKLVNDDENSCQISFEHTYRFNSIWYIIRIVDIPIDLNQGMWTYLSYTVEDDCIDIKSIRAYKRRKGYGRRMMEELKIIARQLRLPIKTYSFSSIEIEHDSDGSIASYFLFPFM